MNMQWRWTGISLFLVIAAQACADFIYPPGVEHNENGVGGGAGAVIFATSCTDGEARDCYGGDPSTVNVGACKYGTQVCTDGVWAMCTGDKTPDTTESCNGIDDDCDGQTDEGVSFHYCEDADGDQFGNPNSWRDECTQPLGYVQNCSDCNDDDGAAHPGHPEVCGDNVDNDCNNIVACECTPGAKKTEWLCNVYYSNCLPLRAITPTRATPSVIAPDPCCVDPKLCTQTCYATGLWSGCEAVP